MKRKTLLLATLVAFAVVMVAAPVSAKPPVTAGQVMVLNDNPATPAPDLGFFGCPEISWFGEITYNGETYGMALYPSPETFFPGNSPIMQYTEDWKIWTHEFTINPRTGKIADCEPGVVIMAGTDRGMAHMDTGVFHSNGVVDYTVRAVAEWDGRHVRQEGLITLVDFSTLEGEVGFNGTFRLN